VFRCKQVHLIGESGTTNLDTIGAIFQGDSYCIISTYASSHLLVGAIRKNTELIVFDEAHHMAGVICKDEDGEGRTRRLMMKATEFAIKRLSLTYTPRFINNASHSDVKHISMDDDGVFGNRIAELKFRELVRKGVLPDYRLWMLRDETKKGTGLVGKAECIIEAWNTMEVERGEEKYLLHHLVIFASSIEDTVTLETILANALTDACIIRAKAGDDMNDVICRFTCATRAILINCYVLNEGVDIPIANAVAITYPKKSHGQITQMVLRAGRWYEGKSVFHILIPTLGDEDLSGFEEVLTSLASSDEQVCDEVLLRQNDVCNTLGDERNDAESYGTSTECIVIDECSADVDEIQRCFQNVRTNIYGAYGASQSKYIRELCIRKNIHTSIEYARLCVDIPELPENPLPKHMVWYDYLHPAHIHRIHCADFVTCVLIPNRLQVSYQYDAWRSIQRPEDIAELPTIQNITDGFFGKNYTEFNTIYKTFHKQLARRR